MFNTIRGISFDVVAELNAVPVRVYDVTEKKLIRQCISVAEASKFTGIHSREISKMVRTKGRSHKNKLNKIICFR